jgi:Phosphotransferase system cellobiose-specific component IIA
MVDIELLAFKMISAIGAARSMYIEGVQKAKEKQFEEAHQMIEEGMELFNEGHRQHLDLIKMEADGNLESISLLLIHVEDLLMSAETLKIMAEEFIAIYEGIVK